MSRAKLAALMKDTEEEEARGDNEEQKEEGSPVGTFVVAVVQNRAKEVGLAALDTRTCQTLWLAQYVEATRGFATTLAMLECYPPHELLIVAPKDPSIPDTGLNAALISFDHTVPLPRCAFDDSEGAILVETCAVPGGFTDSVAGVGSYLALGAAGALLKHMREASGMALAAGCLQVKAALSAHHMHIDAASIEALELVKPAAKGGGGRRTGGTCLLKFLDGTCTRAGAQLLRANLLQPLKDIPTLEARYDAVSELRSNLAFSVGECLAQLPKNMDSVCGGLVLRPAKTEAGMLRRVAAMIQSTIQLRELLSALGPLHEALEPAESVLLCALRSAAADPCFSELLARLEGLLDDDVRSSKGAFLNRTQQCFALRAGVVPLLDVAREAFCNTTDAVQSHANDLRDNYDLPGLKVRYTARRGFYFSVAVHGGGGGGDADGDGGENGGDNGHANGGGGVRRTRKRGTSEVSAAAGAGVAAPVRTPGRLPSCLCLLQSNGRVAQCTTDELNALNSRLRDAANDCLCLTEEALESVTADIVSDSLRALHRLIDALALLDMLCGFVRRLEGTGKPYSRPVLTSSRAGPLALVQCRHAVLEVADAEEFQPNDTWLAVESSMHVITGPNMSGKSTYLRQVALAVIMAQLGCPVAADFASLTPMDRILTRIGTSDCLETNSSSFMVEMQETAYILRHAGPRTLVLIDELGRATSTADGLGVAWSVAEALAAAGAPSMLATHFPELAELADMYPQCRTFHFWMRAPGGNKIEYPWRLEQGRCTDRHYGLALAGAVAFPDDALTRAKTVVQALDQQEERRAMRVSRTIARRESGVWELAGKLACLLQALEGTGDDDEAVRQLKALQEEAAEVLE